MRREAPPEKTIVVTDENIARLHAPLLADFRKIVVPAGEDSKNPEILCHVAAECLRLGADRQTLLLGVGGGMISDLTGFAAAVFMRGIPCAFAPTTVLAMVDAAWGGKNGVNLRETKNILGTIRQPVFVMHLPQTLATLPETEWANGFAEIIKYGCIAEPEILDFLEGTDLSFFRKNAPEMASLVARCVAIKSRFVQADEHETGVRRYLNFGHTLGHAIERQYALSHGAAVGLGMLFAARLSAQRCGLPPETEQRIEQLLERYHLPTHQQLDVDKTLALMQGDKKRQAGQVQYVLLSALGEALPMPLSFKDLKSALQADPRWT